MSEDNWGNKYDQLNQRSRWYSSQLWYVPFAYIGLVGLGLEKIDKLQPPLDSLAYLTLALFSVGVFVHIKSLKYYERRAVESLRELESGTTKSSGGSQWYLGFHFYMQVMLCLASYIFVELSAAKSPFSNTVKCWLQIIGLAFLPVLIVWIVCEDLKRTKPVLDKIRKEKSDNKK
jgi:hypothetical protein